MPATPQMDTARCPTMDNRSFNRVLPCLIACCVLAGFARADNGSTDRLLVGYLEAPPVTYEAKDGRAAGVFIELTRQVAKEAGYELEFRRLPISRLYHELRTGGIDVWPGATDIPAIRNEVLESFISPFAFQVSVWGLADAPPIEHFDDLTDTTLILVSGYTHSGLASELAASPEITVVYAPSHQAALAMLARGRGEYLLDFRDPVRALLPEYPVPGIREYPFRVRNAAWVFSLANPRSSMLRDEFDDAYLRLVDKGEVPPPRTLSPDFRLPGLPQ